MQFCQLHDAFTSTKVSELLIKETTLPELGVLNLPNPNTVERSDEGEGYLDVSDGLPVTCDCTKSKNQGDRHGSTEDQEAQKG